MIGCCCGACSCIVSRTWLLASCIRSESWLGFCLVEEGTCVVVIKGFQGRSGSCLFRGGLVVVESMKKSVGRSSAEILEVVKYSNQEFEKQVNEALISRFHAAAKSSIP